MNSHSVAGDSVPVYSTGGAVVAEIRQDTDGLAWLEKWGLDPRRHQLHKPAAWCTDEAHLALMREMGAVGVKLTTVTGQVWKARLETFERHGFPFNRGHGKQVALPLMWWETSDPKAGRQLSFLEAV